jgi:hypothetical protein
MFSSCAARRATLGTTVFVLTALMLGSLLGGSIPSQASDTAQIDEADPAGAAPAAYYSCTPVRVAVFTNRVHVRCAAAAPGGIVFFAVSTTDSASASRFLSVFSTALATGRQINVSYDANDTSGQAWGCLSADCRIATGAEVH